MAVKFVALYRVPDDVTAFDDAYLNTHLPLVAQWPGLLRSEVARVTRMLSGQPQHLLAEMYFADADALRSAMRSPQWAAAGENLASFGGVEIAMMFTAEVLDDAGAPIEAQQDNPRQGAAT
jgi:uncharacterized protein (TIGR02118 family)